MLESLQLTSHQPVKGRRSQPHPRLSQFHSHWYSPLLSFCWRLSSLLCLWTGILSHRWTPTCKRNRKHPVRPVSTSSRHSSATPPTNPTGEGTYSSGVMILHRNSLRQQHTWQGRWRGWGCAMSWWLSLSLYRHYSKSDVWNLNIVIIIQEFKWVPSGYSGLMRVRWNCDSKLPLDEWIWVCVRVSVSKCQACDKLSTVLGERPIHPGDPPHDSA